MIASPNLAEISDAQTDINGCSRRTGFFAGKWQMGVWAILSSLLVSHPSTQGRQTGRQALSHLIFFWFCIALMGLVSSARTDASIKIKRTRVEEAC